jgi:EpsD family peptidyl-prolyl cis-trans isomerase
MTGIIGAGAHTGSGRAAPALLLASAMALLLAACDDKKEGGGGAPTGQVVARLDGTDITLLEVNAELAGASIPPQMSRRDAEIAALQQIISRRALVQAARERKLDQSPQFKLQERRASEQLLAQAMAAEIAAKIPQPSREDVDKFIAENPDLFDQRKIWDVDQIRFMRPPELEKLPLASIKTMEGVEQVLREAGIEFQRGPNRLDALGANPEFVRAIAKVLAEKPDELFMFPQPVPGGQIMLVNQVRNTIIQPFTGERARSAAAELLRNLRVQEALRKEVEGLVKAARARVTYQDGFAPKEAPAAPEPDKVLADPPAGGVAGPATAPAAAPAMPAGN